MQNQDTSFDFAPWPKSRSVLNIELPPRLVEARISETLIHCWSWLNFQCLLSIDLIWNMVKAPESPKHRFIAGAGWCIENLSYLRSWTSFLKAWERGVCFTCHIIRTHCYRCICRPIYCTCPKQSATHHACNSWCMNGSAYAWMHVR
jgi:hypothetical protein